MNTLADRIAQWNWEAIRHSLDEKGYALTPVLFDESQCANLNRMYDDDSLFRSRIDMARYQFGIGAYKYFADPLPEEIVTLRTSLYPHLAAIANDWWVQLGRDAEFPPEHVDFVERCQQKGQHKPTPLLLTYPEGGYNCLHQDLYGDVYFPFQVVFLLQAAGIDFTGGEFMLVEQRPRAQSRGHVIQIEKGTGLIFPTNHRPVPSARGGYKKVALRHGVSTVETGTRTSLGIIFHDAK